MDSKLLALTAAVGMVLFALGPGVATVAAGTSGNTVGNDSLAVGVSQAGNQGATVTVTDNGTAVEDANVTVEAGENESYVGEDDYVTDENGTVALPAPGETVTVTVTASAHNQTATTTAQLTADTNEAFGRQVSAFIHYLLQSGSTNIGPEVADFVTEHNPGNAPDHAGPPADAGPDGERGPPEDVGPASDDETERGPPEDAGPASDNETERGPPEADVEDDDDDEVDEEDETETDDETDDDEADDDDDDESGPPDHANGKSNGK